MLAVFKKKYRSAAQEYRLEVFVDDEMLNFIPTS
jgi:hypothetical protein